MAKAAAEDDLQSKLFAAAASCARDPLRYVKLAYPWGEKGGQLEKFEGPDVWQAEVLAYIRDNVSRKKPLLIAVASVATIGFTGCATATKPCAKKPCPMTKKCTAAQSGCCSSSSAACPTKKSTPSQ